MEECVALALKKLDRVVDQSGQERDTILLAVRQYYICMSEAEKRIETSKPLSGYR